MTSDDAAHLTRLTPQMHDWVAKILFVLPATPWGAKGAGMSAMRAAVAARREEWEEHKHGRPLHWEDDEEAHNQTKPTEAEMREADAEMVLMLSVMEVLSKARLLYHLFDEDHEAPANRTHSVLPIQTDHPELCPYEPKPIGPTSHLPNKAKPNGPTSPPFDDPRSYAAVLLLLAPVSPAYLHQLYPQCLLLNGGGVGGEMREKLGHRIALRMLLSSGHLSAVVSAISPWVVLPAAYSPQLALAALSRLGGPRHVMLRHPHAVKFTAAGGGELSMEAEDLDEVLFVLLEPVKAKESARVTKRIGAMVGAARFWPEREGPNGEGSAVLLLEELVPSQPLPQDGRKGWFDVTHRAYCVHTPDALADCSGGAGGAMKTLPAPLSAAAAATAAAAAAAAAGAAPAEATAPVDSASVSASIVATGSAPAPDKPATARGVMSGGVCVLSGCCRFPLQNLAYANAFGGVDGQHTPQLPHTAVPLGPEMAKAAFERRLPLAPLFEALHSVGLKELITHCLSSPQHALLHLTGLSILGSATAGARELLNDPQAVHYVHYEYFGRPFSVAAKLHTEHELLIDELVQPSYAQRYGPIYGRLVQTSVLRDVVVPDLACVCSNALRAHSPTVMAWLKKLRFDSQFEDVRQMGEGVYNAFYSIAKTGRQNEHGEPVANKEHMKGLMDSFMNRIP